jgi:hypothetical protein
MPRPTVLASLAGASLLASEPATSPGKPIVDWWN